MSGSAAASSAGAAAGAAGDEPKRKTLKAKFQIGSIHGKVNYKRGQSVFHHSDIPKKALQAKEEVKRSTQKDILGTKRPEWNVCTHIHEKVCVRNSHTLSAGDPKLGGMDYNYRAETLPPKNPAKVAKASKFQMDRSFMEKTGASIVSGEPMAANLRRSFEMPTNPKLDGKAKWDLTTTFTKEDSVRRSNQAEEQRRRNSKRFNASLSKKGYKNPQQIYKQKQAEQRRLRAAGAGKKDDLTQQITKTKTRKYATTVSRKYKKYEHSGVWEFNKAFGKWMWSDTGSEVKESPGDIVTVVDPDAYNFASPYS